MDRPPFDGQSEDDPEFLEEVRQRLAASEADARRDRLFTDAQAMALENLIRVAKSDTGQSRRVADFLLAWWNGAECGGFNLVDAWGLDRELVTDLITVFELIVRCHQYPDTLGYKADLTEIVRLWRSAPTTPPTRTITSSGTVQSFTAVRVVDDDKLLLCAAWWERLGCVVYRMGADEDIAQVFVEPQDAGTTMLAYFARSRFSDMTGIALGIEDGSTIVDVNVDDLDVVEQTLLDLSPQSPTPRRITVGRLDQLIASDPAGCLVLFSRNLER
jgi:hypothetical protein